MTHTSARALTNNLSRVERRKLYVDDQWPWLVHIGIVFLFGASFVLFPGLVRQTAIAGALPEWALRVWSLGLASGCAMTWAHVWTLNSRWEVGGSLTLATWSIVYGYALFAVRGPTVGTVAASIFVGYATLCVSRAFALAYAPRPSRRFASILSWRP